MALGRSVREHKRAFVKAVDSAEALYNHIETANCAKRLLLFRDLWMKAGEAHTHLVDGKAYARPKAGRKGVYMTEWTAEERRLNGLLRRLDRLTQDMQKTCLR